MFYNHCTWIPSWSLLSLILIVYYAKSNIWNQYMNLDLKFFLKSSRFLSKDNNWANLLSTINFWFAFNQVLAVWLSKLSLLPIATPKSLKSLYFPKFSKWHFSVLYFVWSFSNQNIATSVPRTASGTWSQTEHVIPSTKL